MCFFFFHCLVIGPIFFFVFSVIRHGLTVLWEKCNESYFCPLLHNASRLAGIAWLVRELNYGTFPDVGKSEFVLIL